MLIDSITNEIYLFYNTSNNWDEIEAKQTSHKILTLVEEFKQNQEKNILVISLQIYINQLFKFQAMIAELKQFILHVN